MNASPRNLAMSAISLLESREIPPAHCSRDGSSNSLSLSKDKMLPLVSQAWFWEVVYQHLLFVSQLCPLLPQMRFTRHVMQQFMAEHFSDK